MKHLYFLNAVVCLLMTVEIHEGCNTTPPAPASRSVTLETAVWQLTDILADPVPMHVPDTLAVPITIKFSEGEIQGFGGCNGFGGNYTYLEDQLSVSDIMHTEMYCEGGSEWEALFLQRLNQSRTFQIIGETLEIRCGDSGGLKFRLNWKKRKG